MRFHNLTINNFLSVGTATLDLADRGLVLIAGENEDNSSASSNGAGKTTIAEALSWVLYGTTARRVTGDAVVSSKTGKNTSVSLIISDGDKKYRITRYRKHKDGKNDLILEGWDDASKSFSHDMSLGTAKLTQDAIERLLGCSYDVFSAAVYASQENFVDLPSLTDKQLKVLIEEASGVTVLEAAYRAALAEHRMILDEVEKHRLLLSKMDDALAMSKEDRESVLLSQKDRELLKTRRISERKGEINYLKSCIADARDSIEALGPAAVKTELASIRDKLDSMEEQREKERMAQRAVSAAEAVVTFSMDSERIARNRLASAEERFRSSGSLVGKPCSECGKPYCEEDLTEAVERARADAAAMADEFDQAKRAHLMARRTLVAANAELNAVKESFDLSGLLSRQSGLLETEKKIAKFLSEAKTWAAIIKKAAAEIEELEKEEDPFASRIASLDKRILELEAGIVEKGAVIEDEKKKEQVARKAIEVFSPAGVRALILDEVTPYLNARTSRYLAALSDGNTTATWTTLTRNAKGELSEKFSIEVKDRSGAESFSGLSGGEKRKVRIAASLALQDLVARRASKPIDLFFADEIDDALDDAGLERLMILLEEKARERGSVFVISHNSLSDWVSNVITVRKKDGISELIS